MVFLVLCSVEYERIEMQSREALLLLVAWVNNGYHWNCPEIIFSGVPSVAYRRI